MAGAEAWIALAIVLLFVVILLLSRAMHVIQPYQRGIVTVLGSYRGLLNPGFNFISPLARVSRVDMRAQVVPVPNVRIATRDLSALIVGATIHFKVVDALKASFQVQDYRDALVSETQAALRTVVADLDLVGIRNGRPDILRKVHDRLTQVAGQFGVQFEDVELTGFELAIPVSVPPAGATWPESGLSGATR